MSTAVNYDDDGNVVSYDLRHISSIEYDHRNLPLSITGNNGTSSYGYDDAGNRIFKTAAGKKEFYLRSVTGRELAIYEYNNDGRDNLKTVNLYGTGLIGRIDVRYVPYTYTDPETHDTINTIRRNDERFYYINDHLGSVRAIVDSSGTTVFAQDTYPYGDVYRNYTLGGYADQKYDFTGKERDVETGLHYYGARYYDSDLGVWLQVDPLADKYPGWSPYNYCVNNPVRNVDPTGMDWVESNTATGGYMWNEDVHNQDDADRTYGKGKTRYKGSHFTYTDKRYGKRDYNSDGSIYFYTEQFAYQFLWDRSLARNKENLAVIFTEGIIVLDDSKAERSSHPTPDIKAINVKHNIKTIAVIHTHLHGNPSKEDKQWSTFNKLPLYTIYETRMILNLPGENPKDVWMITKPPYATNYIPADTIFKLKISLISYTVNQMWRWAK